MNYIETKYGLMQREWLDVRDVVQEDANSRSIATEWVYIGEPITILVNGEMIPLSKGEVVRRDGHVMILRTQAIGGEQVRM